MSSQAVRVFALEVKPGDPPVPVNGEGLPAQVRITMAAIDPTAPAQLDMAPPGQEIPRATLKLIKINIDEDEQDPEDDEDDYDEHDVSDIERRLGMAIGDIDDDDSEAENGGPSNKETKAEVVAKIMSIINSKDSDDDEDMEVDDLPNGVNGTKSKKGKAIASESDEEIDSDDEEDIDDIVEHAVVCTLDTTHHFQQPLDIVVGENEQIYVEAIGTHSVYLTGNYIAILDDDDEDDEDYEDYSDEDDDMGLYGGELGESDEESDELDDIEDPRITEVDSEEEEAPALAKASSKKGKNKRPAEDSDDGLTELINKAKAGVSAADVEEPKQSKKKLKNNEGQAVAGADKKEKKKEAAEAKQKTDKKVQFAKNLELGPTGSPKPITKAGQEKNGTAKEEPKPAIKSALGVKKVGGVTIDDKKAGKGPAAKSGDKIGMRYIGKLENGKIFDSNKKGKPFTFTLGKGEVIKGWDVGVAGITAGAERRITVPAKLAYGGKALPGIPANSTLIFDVKCLSVN